jgi:hypothetical protein
MSMDATANPQAATVGTAGPAKALRGTKGRNVKYPAPLKVNLSRELNASVGRLARQYDVPEGMIGRMAIKQFCISQDALFRQQLNSIEANERNQE